MEKICQNKDKKLNGYIMSGDIKVVKIENNVPKVINKDLCPLYFKYNIDFKEWLSSRAIDSHRANSRLLKKMLRLEEKDDVSTTLKVHAVTITDNYWFKENEETLNWEDVKFKEDLFSTIALNGSLNNIDFDSNKITTHTPELTNIGSYEKCWKLDNNKWYLWKKESKEEMFSELFSYHLGKLLGFNMAEYKYDNGYIKSNDFTNGNNVNFESFYSIVKDDENYSKSFNYLYSLSNKEIAKDYLKMIYLDSICYNVDRHTKNYGVLRNKETGEIISLSPNYDNNIALIARGTVNDITRKKDVLLKFFYEFIEENNQAEKMFKSLEIPKITKEMIVSAIDNTKIEIDNKTKEYIISFILNGQERISESINKEAKMKEKANYCLNCPTKSCATGCPLENDIPSFIKEIKEGDYKKAYEILSETTVLQPVCGRICPHEKQCRGKCVRGIKGEPVSIGELEAFVGDIGVKNNWHIPESETKTNKKVAIVGGGPSGLTAGAFLRRKGYNVTIYEKYNKLGGLLSHGIPEFRLPRDILNKTIEKILDLGINVKYNCALGKEISLEDLKKEYDAVLLTFGANISAKMGIEGEDLKGVYGGNELLENNNHPNYKGKIVVVNGGGNTAMDTSRTINKMGAKKVYVVYRRAREQMPAEQKEIDDAISEGVEFLFQNNIVNIIGDKYVEKIECIKTELIKVEGESRLKPVNIEGSNYEIPVDYVVMAVGSKPEESVLNTLNLNKNKWGYIETDEENRTSDEKVFCAGDISGAKSTVAWAARSGRNAAETIHKFLTSKN